MASAPTSLGNIAAAPKAVIAGAGPAGCLAAMYLAKLGWSVHIFEQRAKPTPNTASKLRSYPIVLGDRALAALRPVADFPDGHRFKYKGYVTVYANSRTVFPASEDMVMLTRTELASHLIQQAEQKFAASVIFTFSTPCTGVDLASRDARFAGDGDGAIHASYDLLVGADGAHSVVRQVLMDAHLLAQTDTLDSPHARSAYKIFTNLPAELAPAMLQDDQPDMPGSYLYDVRSPQPGSFGFGSMTVWRDSTDGSYNGLAMAPKGVWDLLKSEEDYEAAACKHIPSLAAEWSRSIAKQLVTAPISSYRYTQRYSSLVGPGVVLLGDAAHPITPAAGEGAQSAMDDCSQLAQALQHHTDSVQDALQEFEAVRGPNIRALALIDNMVGWYAFGNIWLPQLPFGTKLAVHWMRFQVYCYTLMIKAVRTLLPWVPPRALRLAGSTSYAMGLLLLRLSVAAVLVGGVAMAGAASFILAVVLPTLLHHDV